VATSLPREVADETLPRHPLTNVTPSAWSITTSARWGPTRPRKIFRALRRRREWTSHIWVSVHIPQLDLRTAKPINRHAEDHEGAPRQKQDLPLMAMHAQSAAWITNNTFPKRTDTRRDNDVETSPGHRTTSPTCSAYSSIAP
jgi:hypothetical protein